MVIASRQGGESYLKPMVAAAYMSRILISILLVQNFRRPRGRGGQTAMRAGSAWAGLLIKTGKNRERQNVIWNMAGSFCYAFASMVLSFLVLRIIGEEEGGIFSFGYSTLGQQMFIVAYFGIRPFQVTDAAGQFRFGDYLRHRLATCGLALLAGAGYLAVSGYTAYKAAVLFLLVGYKVLDGFADVYESEFQRCGRLYLTGKSNTFRTLLSVGVFLLTLLAGRTHAAFLLCRFGGPGGGNLAVRCFRAAAAAGGGPVPAAGDYGSADPGDGAFVCLRISGFLRLFRGKICHRQLYGGRGVRVFQRDFYAHVHDQSGGGICDTAGADLADRLLERRSVPGIFLDAAEDFGADSGAEPAGGGFGLGPGAGRCWRFWSTCWGRCMKES